MHSFWSIEIGRFLDLQKKMWRMPIHPLQTDTHWTERAKKRTFYQWSFMEKVWKKLTWLNWMQTFSAFDQFINVPHYYIADQNLSFFFPFGYAILSANFNIWLFFCWKKKNFSLGRIDSFSKFAHTSTHLSRLMCTIRSKLCWPFVAHTSDRKMTGKRENRLRYGRTINSLFFINKQSAVFVHVLFRWEGSKVLFLLIWKL